MRFRTRLLVGCIALTCVACGSDTDRGAADGKTTDLPAVGSTTAPTQPPAITANDAHKSAESTPTAQDEVVGEEVDESNDLQDGPPPSTTPLPDGVVGDSYCPPNASCAQGFVLNDTFYGVDCTALRNDAVQDEQVGSGRAFETEIAVHPINGFDASEVVAINVPGGFCSEDALDQPTSDWSLAIADGTDQQVVLAAACDVGLLSAAQSSANGCT